MIKIAILISSLVSIQPGSVKTINAETLYENYEGNELKADKEYRGKVFLVRGIVGAVDNEGCAYGQVGSLSVGVSGPNRYSKSLKAVVGGQVCLAFTKEALGVLEKIDINSIVKMKCVILGKDALQVVAACPVGKEWDKYAEEE